MRSWQVSGRRSPAGVTTDGGVDAGAVARHPDRVRAVPLGQAIWLGQARCDAQGENCVSNGWDQYVDVARSEEFQHVMGDGEVRLDHRAHRRRPRDRAGGLADKYLRGVGVFRTVFSSTVATSVAVASLMWLFLLQPDVGVLANVGWIGSVPGDQVGLLRDPGTALMSVAATSIWANLGFTFILITAGLQGIRATSTRRRWSTKRAGSAGSGV